MSFDEVWATFLSADTTLGPTPGVRDAWRDGRARYAVWVIRVAEPAARARLSAMADHLAPHGVVPFRDPHVTVFVAGFPTRTPHQDDDVHEDVLAAQVAALTAARPRRPRLVVAGLNAFLSCPVLEVWDPHDDLAAIREPLAALRPEIRFAPYRPHVTVGAFGDTRAIGPIVAAVAPHRALPPIALAVDAVELVSFDAGEVGGALRTEARVALRRRDPGLPSR